LSAESEQCVFSTKVTLIAPAFQVVVRGLRDSDLFYLNYAVVRPVVVTAYGRIAQPTVWKQEARVFLNRRGTFGNKDDSLLDHFGGDGWERKAFGKSPPA
jgi:hypothetical protein